MRITMSQSIGIIALIRTLLLALTNKRIRVQNSVRNDVILHERLQVRRSVI